MHRDPLAPWGGSDLHLRPMLKSLLTWTLLGALAALLLAAVALVMVLESTPRVLQHTPPSPADVQQAKGFVRGVRDALNTQTGAPAPFNTDLTALNATLKLGARLIPGFRGEMESAFDQVIGHASIPVPFTDGGKWLNVTLAAPSFEGEFKLSQAQIGPIQFPPGMTLTLLRVGANMIFDNQLGDAVTSAARGMTIDGSNLRFTLAMDQVGGNGIMRGVFGTLRGRAMPGDKEITRYYYLIREAMESGELPTKGSYLPYLAFTLAAAENGAEQEGTDNAYTSALFALTLICGARDFTLVVGGLVTGDLDDGRAWTKNCSNITLNDRIDSRRHFTTAAAIQAASNRGFAVSVGEFKELNDTLKAGGFDFTDIAANNSGIRLSNRFMGADLRDWPTLRARINDERDVIVAYDDIPPIMSEAHFNATYGDIEDPRYLAMLNKIERKIDQLPIYQ